MSSPMISSHDSNSSNDSGSKDIDVDSSPESTMCDCQSQLKHHDWDGVPREDLPDLCKRTMGIPVENIPISKEDCELNHPRILSHLRIDEMLISVEDASATESDPEYDLKREHCKTNRFESTKLTQCCSESTGYSSKTEELGPGESE